MTRGSSFIHEIADEFLPKSNKQPAKSSSPIKVLVVTHGGFIGEFLNVVKGLEGR